MPTPIIRYPQERENLEHQATTTSYRIRQTFLAQKILAGVSLKEDLPSFRATPPHPISRSLASQSCRIHRKTLLGAPRHLIARILHKAMGLGILQAGVIGVDPHPLLHQTGIGLLMESLPPLKTYRVLPLTL